MIIRNVRKMIVGLASAGYAPRGSYAHETWTQFLARAARTVANYRQERVK